MAKKIWKINPDEKIIIKNLRLYSSIFYVCRIKVHVPFFRRKKIEIKYCQFNFRMVTDPDVAREEAFRRFRPYCAALVAKPNQATLEKLGRLINLAHPDDLNSLEEYLIFPLQVYLKTPVMPENYTISVLTAMEKFYQRTGKLGSYFVLKDVIGNVTSLVSKEQGQKLSEDIKVASNKCLSVMISKATCDVKLRLFEEEMKLPLSHLIFTVSNFTEKNRDLANVLESSLDLLSAFLPTSDKDEFCKSFCSIFSQMLPGISTALMKILKDTNPKVSVKSKARALDIWTGYVTLILSDSRIFHDDEEKMSESGSFDAKWLNKARDHIAMQLQIMMALASSISSDRSSHAAKLSTSLHSSIKSNSRNKYLFFTLF